MIQNRRYLSIAEVQEYVDGKNEKSKEILNFIKKFTKLSPKEAKELRKKLEELEIAKMKEEFIIKIIDILPDNSAELNKILQGTGMDENETTKILAAIKQFK
jgi:DNA-directed RNA polymerase subunit F